MCDVRPLAGYIFETIQDMHVVTYYGTLMEIHLLNDAIASDLD